MQAKAGASRPFHIWEFVAGPMHAGGFGPGKLDNSLGQQYYGLAKIDGKTGALKVQIKDLNGATLYEKTLT